MSADGLEKSGRVPEPASRQDSGLLALTGRQQRQAEDLLANALQHSSGERLAYLHRAHPQPDPVRLAVEQLLTESPPPEASAIVPPSPVSEPPPASSALEGQTIGHYQIEGLLGEGGMGRVYRARDLRINRLVAIKFVSSRLVTSPDQKRRFLREASVLGQLAHPHLCALYDVGEHEGMPYLVMEYLEGETLEERLSRGLLPLEAILLWAEQLADALSTAHRHGVIHRDIKPGNVMLTRSGARLLDFGVARVEVGGLLAGPVGPSLTSEGMVVGTVRYMSPEQLQGGPIDARSDVFAFGALLYEMLTGQPAFAGQSAASVIAAILLRPVDAPSVRQPRVPPLLDRIVARCLAKDAAARWPGMSDILRELRVAAAGASSTTAVAVTPPARAVGRRWAWPAALAAALLLPWALRLVPRPPPPGAPVSLALMPPPRMSFFASSAAAELAVSADGRKVVFVAGDNNGQSRLWVRDLGSPTAAALAGTEDGHFPFWSPDGQEVAFFSSGSLRRVSIAGGPPRVVCSDVDGRGGTWSPNGTIVFAPGTDTRLMQVPAAGGQPTPATMLNKSGRELSHRWPQFLPDGRRFVFLVQSEAGGQPGIYAGELGSASIRRLTEDALAPVYAAPGYLLTIRDGQLIARRMDPRTLQVDGTPMRLAENVSGYLSSGRIGFAAGGGTLVRGYLGTRSTELSWVERTGSVLGPVRGFWSGARLTSMTPDGRHVTLEQPGPPTRPNTGWLLDTERGSRMPLAGTEGTDHFPLLSPDGQHTAFGCTIRGGPERLCLARVDGTRTEVAVPAGNVNPLDWSRDGRRLLFETTVGGLMDIAALDVETRRISRIARVESDGTQAQLSPDGRWLALVLRPSRQPEVYLQAFPGPGPRWSVSPRRGMRPRWRGDGKELFYVEPGEPARMISVPVQAGAAVELGAPVPLFPAPPSLINYTVTADGRRFLLNASQANFGEPLTVMLNWAPPQ